MTASVRKYNPGFLTDEELMASFCVRQAEFDSMVEMLRECTGPSNQHQIVIGPRGSGKTSLLLRVAAEVRRDPELSRRFFPVVFAEESYEVSNVGEFWLEALSRLADQAPHRDRAPDLHLTCRDLRTLQDDQALGERSLAALLDFSDREGKRLVLMVENLNMIFRDMSDRDAGWRLRKILQTEPRIILLASATSRFAEIDHPDHALYDLFRVRTLQPLDTEECTALWETVSGSSPPRQTIRPLEILTGGSPRLVTIVARFGAELSFRELMDDLLDLVDEHTEYFKGHIEALPAQERRVYLALADLWKPATTREIAERSRIETSKCSAQLTRLTERGVVRVTGGSARRKQYYLSERLYNIYYLVRRNRGPDSLIQALLQFMESFYSPSDIRDIGLGIARQAGSLHPETPSFHRTALTRLAELPALADHREELLALVQDHSAELVAAKSLIDRAAELGDQERPEEELAVLNEVERRFRNSSAPALLELRARALSAKGSTLVRLNQREEALATFDQVVHRCKGSDTPVALYQIAKSLTGKGLTLWDLRRSEEALPVLEEVVRRFAQGQTPAFPDQVAIATLTKGHALRDLERAEEALSAYHEAVRQFGESEVSNAPLLVAIALVCKGDTLSDLNLAEEALSTYDEVISRFKASTSPDVLSQIAAALVQKAAVLSRIDRPEEALAALDEAIGQFAAGAGPQELVARALVGKGSTLAELNRPEEALCALDEVERRFGHSEDPDTLVWVSRALVNRGITLGELQRSPEELLAYDEVVRRFEDSETPAVLESVAKALLNKGVALGRLTREEEALAVFNKVVRRFQETESPDILALVGKALANKGVTLGRLHRTEEELAAYDELVLRFGERNTPDALELVATALLNKGVTLGELTRTEEELAAYDELLQRLEGTDSLILLETVAKVLIIKGSKLRDLNRTAEALAACDEVVRRFGDNVSPSLRELTEGALIEKAHIELGCKHYEAAARTAGQVFEERCTESTEHRWTSRLIHAKATLATGDSTKCERDVEAILAILPQLDSLPWEILEALLEFTVALGPERMWAIVHSSPAASVLLPLVTALEQELGLEPRVALEVAEVARDIRKDLAKLRHARGEEKTQSAD